MALFNPYRGFLIQNSQMTIDEVSSNLNFHEKQNLLRLIIIELKKEIKFLYEDDKDNELILYFHNQLDDDIVILQFARKKDLKIRRPKEKAIEEDKEDDFPYIYIIVDIKTQVFLFEHSTIAFNNTSTSKNFFRKLINEYLRKYNFTIEFDKILDEGEFWFYVKKLEQINYVKLSLNSPNLFGGMFETNKLLKKLKEIHNNKKFEFALINEEDTLDNIVKEELDDSIRYIENGGGSWSIKGKTKQNTLLKRNSEELIKKVLIDEIDNKEKIYEELYKINEDLIIKDKK